MGVENGHEALGYGRNVPWTSSLARTLDRQRVHVSAPRPVLDIIDESLADGIVEDVFIEYSANNGADWTPIDTSANIGSYSWLVPDVNSDECLVWISDAGYRPAGDLSDDVFRIYVCTLAFDLNHDCVVDFFDFSLLASEWLECGDPADPDCVP